MTTAKTLGYDQSHEYIYKGLVDLSDSLEGEWIGFETFLEMLTHTVVLVDICRVMVRRRRGGDRHLRCWIGRVRVG